MSRHEVMKCDNCRCDINTKIRHKYTPIIIEVGYSEGGWGSRKDLIDKDTFDLCDKCYTDFTEALTPILNRIKLYRKGKYNIKDNDK